MNETPSEEEELSRGGANEAIALKQFKLLSMKGVLIALYQKFCDGLDWPWVWDTDLLDKPFRRLLS